jgi:tRNA A37 methylthiotransferase MiaB
MVQRAEDRIGETVEVIIESIDPETGAGIGHAGHQGPDDSETHVIAGSKQFTLGSIISCEIIDTEGVDLIAEVVSA